MLKARVAAQAPAMNTINVNALERGVGRPEERTIGSMRAGCALFTTLDQNASCVQPHDPILPLARRFTIPSLGPPFDIDPFWVAGRCDGPDRVGLWARDAQGRLAMQASAQIA